MRKKTLEEIFNITKGDIVSIVGSSGKTTLLFQLAKELKEQYHVLTTTSTKIYKPSTKDCSLYTNLDSYINNKDRETQKDITVISRDIDCDKNKLIGINDNDLEKIINDFDLAIIEADGSRKLPLKGWKEYEPVILSMTNKTIGIIPIDMLFEKVNKNYIYGFEEFKKLVNNAEFIDCEAIGEVCSNENGLFKNSRGILYLYINKADTEEDINKSLYLSNYLKKFVVGNPYNFKICFGSFKQGEFYEY